MVKGERSTVIDRLQSFNLGIINAEIWARNFWYDGRTCLVQKLIDINAVSIRLFTYYWSLPLTNETGSISTWFFDLWSSKHAPSFLSVKYTGSHTLCSHYLILNPQVKSNIWIFNKHIIVTICAYYVNTKKLKRKFKFLIDGFIVSEKTS